MNWTAVFWKNKLYVDGLIFNAEAKEKQLSIRNFGIVLKTLYL